MAALVDSVAAQFDTDFAILSAGQLNVANSPGMSFAMSAPGYVSLQCGTKYSRVQIRAERWDGWPPLIDRWEDVNELPFQEVPGGGELTLSGFDQGDGDLDVEEFGLGRIQVFARGRHRCD